MYAAFDGETVFTVGEGHSNSDELGRLRLSFAAFENFPEVTDVHQSRYEWVYFVQSLGAPGLIKIGRAYDLRKRLLSLQGSCATPLKVVGLVCAPRGSEFIFHEIWNDLRIHGEWFYPDSRFLEFIAKLPRGKTIEIPYLRDLGAARVGDIKIKKILLKGMRRRRKKPRLRLAA